MKRLQNKAINEFFDRSEAKATKYKNKMYLVAVIPTLLLAIYIFENNTSLDTTKLIILGMALVGFYIICIMGTIVAVDCWSIAEMVSPRIQGRYKNFKAFVKIIVDSPDKRQVLRVTKLFDDILEKNGFQNYHSASEFMKIVYDRIDGQDQAIKKKDGLIQKLAEDLQNVSANVQELKDEIKKLKGE